MPADVLGRGMQHDRRAMVERPAEHRRRRVVHDQRHAELAADLRHLTDREHGQLGVGQRLGIVAARLGVGGAAKILRVGRIDETAFDAHRLHGVGEQVPGAAVEIRRGDEIVAGMADVLDREQRRRLARAQRQRGDAALEGGDPRLQHVVRRVHDAAVDVAELGQAEQVGGMLGVAELVAGGLVDRHRHRVGRRIAAIARMQYDGLRMLAVRCHALALSALPPALFTAADIGIMKCHRPGKQPHNRKIVQSA